MLLHLALVLERELNMPDLFGIYVSMLMLRYPKDTGHLKALLLGCPSEASTKCYNTTECQPWTLNVLASPRSNRWLPQIPRKAHKVLC